ncbi:hypothetical protein BAUCODRAFT_39469 [Baudoinia panamericana UAMH 10762]|uniref:TUG ubiquitin-like domain-containing protein n=1 Tax=Baudoinia panamericana (strain UAMH 10762) TaxID=717646 RepID=M2M3Z6_BAUPA|nr:uncharacterized protein BAUCODRAFT_39469 [Baudoinia panamericana UAMH 10762]EMC91301.1 hypothetical protein BAUCODRAFT_39469 [Baudoinia panamericana UAMH 10762]
MSTSSIFVVDSTARRTQVKVTPGKYLREVLEEACRSRKLNPEGYTLRTQNNKTLDLSQPFRLSGLSAGAKLQLVQASRSPSVVSVALQLPESEGGGRIEDKFPSTTSLWLLLRKFEDGVAGSARKLNITQRGVPSGSTGAGRLLYEQPCLNIMGRTMESFVNLQKTLAQLGYNSGSVLVRLTFAKTEQPLEEAMQEITTYFASIDGTSAGTGSGASHSVGVADVLAVNGGRPNAEADNAAALPEAPGPERNEDVPIVDGPTAPTIENDVLASSTITDPDTSTTEPSTESASTMNGISVYRPPSSSTPAAALAPDDPSVFEPHIEHAKAHQAALERAGRNTRLLSDRELAEQEAERQEKLATVQSVRIRVRYPDQYSLVITMTNTDTAADLYSKVMDTLTAAPEPFELRYLGSKGHQTLPNSPSQRLVRDMGFRGGVVVTIGWSPDASLQARQGPSLKAEYRAQAQELKVDLAERQAEGQAAHKAAMAKPEKVEGKKENKARGDVEAKMKKFLGFGKK